jgi:hypothetical protein
MIIFRVLFIFTILFLSNLSATSSWAQENQKAGIEPINHPAFQSKIDDGEKGKRRNLGKFFYWIKNRVKSQAISFSSIAILFPKEENKEKKPHWAAVLGFLFSSASLFVAGIPFGLLGFILSFIGLRKIYQNPEKHSGKAVAMIGLFLGVVGVAGAIIVIKSML